MGKDNNEAKDTRVNGEAEASKVGCWRKVRRTLALTDENATPVEWKTIGLVVLALFVSSYSITFIFPYVPDMILWFGYKEEEKGYYSGLLASSMFAGRIFASYFWGWLSDRKGRRPVICVSLVLTMLTNFAFAFSTSLTMAIILRFINGLLNGIIGACKSVLYEVSDNSNQGVGMSSISFAWGGGLIMGPLISGILADPVRHHPEVFPNGGGVLNTLPFLLPGLMAGLVCVGPIVLIWWKLPETRKIKEITVEVDTPTESKGDSDNTAPSGGRLLAAGVNDSAQIALSPLLQRSVPLSLQQSKPFTASHYSLKHADSVDIPLGNDETSRVYGYGLVATSQGDLLFPDLYDSFDQKMTSTPLKKEFSRSDGSGIYTENNARKRCSTMDQPKSKHSNEGPGDMEVRSPLVEKRIDPNNADASKKHSRKPTVLDRIKATHVWRVLSNKECRLSIAIYFTVSFGVIGYEEVFTVFASTDRSLGGLGMSPMAIGNAQGLSAVPLVLIAAFLFPILERRIGAKLVFNVFDLYLIFVAILLPCIRTVVDHRTLFWTIILIALGLRGIAVTSCFSANGLHINNSVPPELAGSINGIAMTIAAIGRMLAPTVGGSLFAWSITSGTQIGFPFDVNLVFILFGCCYFIGNILCAILPDSLDKQGKKNQS